MLDVEYLAPELVLNTGHDHQCDMWALGVLLFEMCSCTTPFHSVKNDVVEVISKIAGVKKHKVHFHHLLEKREHALKDFIFKCLLFSPVE